MLGMRLKRAVSASDGAISSADANLNGAEFVAKDADGNGVRLRYASAEVVGAATSIAAGKLEYVDGTVVLGGKSVAITGGYRLRTFRYPLTVRRLHYAHAGFQAGYRFAGAGFELTAGGSYVRSITQEKSDSVLVSGLEGETAIRYNVPRLPLFVTFGYRRELFDLKKGATFPRREELGGIVFAVGVQTGLSSR